MESRQKPTPVADWDLTYREGNWDYLASIAETPRYAAVAGYVHKLVRHGCVLDAGCGEGLLVDYLDLGRLTYTGFDLSTTAIDRARKRYSGVTLFPCSLDEFAPANGEKYDIIVFNEVLTSIDRSHEILDRYFTFLAPSGHIVLSQFQNSNPTSNASIFTGTLEAEIAAGRYHVAARSQTLNCDTGFSWNVYCLDGSQRNGLPEKAGGARP